jgi:hypothetical protein
MLVVSMSEAKQNAYDVLSKCKSVRSKKACMTRLIKQQNDYVNEIFGAVTLRKGWYLGELYTFNDYLREQRILLAYKVIREDLNCSTLLNK